MGREEGVKRKFRKGNRCWHEPNCLLKKNMSLTELRRPPFPPFRAAIEGKITHHRFDIKGGFDMESIILLAKKQTTFMLTNIIISNDQRPQSKCPKVQVQVFWVQ